MNDLILFIIILGPLFTLIIALLLFLMGIFKKKRRLLVWGILCILFFSVQAVIRMRISGEIGSNTKASGKKIQIVQRGTGSMGSYGTYIMEPEGVIVEVDEIDEGNRTVRFGWKFEAIDEGECLVIVHQFDCADLGKVNAYQVKVDETGNITYKQKEVEYPGGVKIRYFDDSCYTKTKKITINTGNKLWHTEDSAQMEDMRGILCRIVGENIECEKPVVNGMTELNIVYERRDSVKEEEKTFYINQKGQVYYKMVQWHNYEEPYDQWYLFTPDEWCDVTYEDFITKYAVNNEK